MLHQSSKNCAHFMNFSISAYPTPKKIEKIAKDLVLMDSKVFFLESGCVAEKSTFHRFEFNLVFFFFLLPPRRLPPLSKYFIL